MRLRSRHGIEAVDVIAAGIVDEVGFGRADEVAQLIVTASVSRHAQHTMRTQSSRDGDLGGIVGLGGQHKRVRVSTPATVSMPPRPSTDESRAQEVINGHGLRSDGGRGLHVFWDEGELCELRDVRW